MYLIKILIFAYVFQISTQPPIRDYFSVAKREPMFTERGLRWANNVKGVHWRWKAWRYNKYSKVGKVFRVIFRRKQKQIDLTNAHIVGLGFNFGGIYSGLDKESTFTVKNYGDENIKIRI